MPSSHKRYICIHGHFYQPPRENPWLEAIEAQDSAAPYHDWNERITDECYRPNAESRILDDDLRVCRIINNYARMSFNFGPTLLSWLELHAREVHDAIVEADRESLERFAGHGAALAQPYNHMIMPLANERDRLTQLQWGLGDFRDRFGREPEGVWLPEAAVDTASLEDLAAHGIKFTVLAPRQAKRFRLKGETKWTDCASAGIDPARAYRCNLPSGNHIALFFYDGPISQAVAFERLLNNGNTFAARLKDALSDDRDFDQLAHIATDGETYGHHHRHGEMALSVALEALENDPSVELTNYGRFLEQHPPEAEAQIHDNSSWSCVHGVERWRSDCGCNAGNRPGWDQSYRKPLRDALDNLRDKLARLFEAQAGEFLADPWAARDDYISVINDRSGDGILDFLDLHTNTPLPEQDRTRVIKLLEMQRHAMLMYTSCGWFFDELSGLETVQVLKYAGRALQLAEELSETRFEHAFLADLDHAPSNIAQFGSGRDIYNRLVRPAVVDLPRLCAHYAVSSVFTEDGEIGDQIYCYKAEPVAVHRFNAGRTRMLVGRVKLSSNITLDHDTLTFAVLHAGDHIISGGARSLRSQESFSELLNRVGSSFEAGDIAAIIHAIEHEFSVSSFSLRSLFADEQRRIAGLICSSAIDQVESVYASLHEQHQTLVRYLSGAGIPVPEALRLPSQFVVNRKLMLTLESDDAEPGRIVELLRQAEREDVVLDASLVAFRFGELLTRLSRSLLDDTDPDKLARVAALLDVMHELPVQPDLSRAQLAIYRLWREPDAITTPRRRDPAVRELIATVASRLDVCPQTEPLAT